MVCYGCAFFIITTNSITKDNLGCTFEHINTFLSSLIYSNLKFSSHLWSIKEFLPLQESFHMAAVTVNQ